MLHTSPCMWYMSAKKLSILNYCISNYITAIKLCMAKTTLIWLKILEKCHKVLAKVAKRNSSLAQA